MHENVCINQRWLDYIEIALLLLLLLFFTEITHVCVEECLFIQSLYFPSVIF